jgi:hypothetical protein
MRRRTPPVACLAALLAASLLAGCAEGGGDGLDAAAAGLDVEATATTGVIRGVVVDEAVRPIAGAKVVLADGTETTSNDKGAFGFDGLQPGLHFMTASALDHATVQQSVDVVAGDSDPAPVRVLLQSIPRATPFIEAFSSRLYFAGAVSTPVVLVRLGDMVGDEGNYAIEVPIEPNGTVAQAEFVWEPSSPLGEAIWFGGGTYAGDEDVDEVEAAGPSPVVLLASATKGGDTADKVVYHMWSDGGGQPLSAHAQQSVDAFVHVFHNFLPNDGWLFTRDGAHPLPP